MPTINTTRTTPAAASQTPTGSQTAAQTTPTWTNADLTAQGTTQGIRVAQTEAGNPNFDMASYASSITPYLQGLGLTSTQISTYLSAMTSEFNYLTPTAQLDPSNSNVGSDILNDVLPSASDPGAFLNPGVATLQTLVNQGTVLGQQLAAVQNDNASNFDIAAYTQHVAKQMSAAGYNISQTDAFSSALMMGYASAIGGYISG